MKIKVGWGNSLESGLQALRLITEGTLLFPQPLDQLLILPVGPFLTIASASSCFWWWSAYLSSSSLLTAMLSRFCSLWSLPTVLPGSTTIVSQSCGQSCLDRHWFWVKGHLGTQRLFCILQQHFSHLASQLLYVLFCIFFVFCVVCHCLQSREQEMWGHGPIHGRPVQ